MQVLRHHLLNMLVEALELLLIQGRNIVVVSSKVRIASVPSKGASILSVEVIVVTAIPKSTEAPVVVAA